MHSSHALPPLQYDQNQYSRRVRCAWAVYFVVTNQPIHGSACAPCWNTGSENKKDSKRTNQTKKCIHLSFPQRTVTNRELLYYVQSTYVHIKTWGQLSIATLQYLAARSCIDDATIAQQMFTFSNSIGTRERLDVDLRQSSDSNPKIIGALNIQTINCTAPVIKGAPEPQFPMI